MVLCLKKWDAAGAATARITTDQIRAASTGCCIVGLVAWVWHRHRLRHGQSRGLVATTVLYLLAVVGVVFALDGYRFDDEQLTAWGEAYNLFVSPAARPSRWGPPVV